MFQIFGTLTQPEALQNFGSVQSGGLGKLLNLLFNVLIVAGGIYAVFNFILAGYAFMSAGDDPKKMEAAWGKIYQTAIGLVFLVGSFLLAAVFGQLILGDYGALLNPIIPAL